jgi:hypothetical protein
MRVGTTPWRRKSARTVASLLARLLPLTFLPFLSVPSHKKGVLIAAVSAIYLVR